MFHAHRRNPNLVAKNIILPSSELNETPCRGRACGTTVQALAGVPTQENGRHTARRKGALLVPKLLGVGHHFANDANDGRHQRRTRQGGFEAPACIAAQQVEAQLLCTRARGGRR